jgi:hypothetical protein
VLPDTIKLPVAPIFTKEELPLAAIAPENVPVVPENAPVSVHPVNWQAAGAAMIVPAELVPT